MLLEDLIHEDCTPLVETSPTPEDFEEVIMDTPRNQSPAAEIMITSVKEADEVMKSSDEWPNLESSALPINHPAATDSFSDPHVQLLETDSLALHAADSGDLYLVDNINLTLPVAPKLSSDNYRPSTSTSPFVEQMLVLTSIHL